MFHIKRYIIKRFYLLFLLSFQILRIPIFQFNKKTKLKLTDFECNLLGGGMNEFRNTLLSDGISTKDVDELLYQMGFKQQKLVWMCCLII